MYIKYRQHSGCVLTHNHYFNIFSHLSSTGSIDLSPTIQEVVDYLGHSRSVTISLLLTQDKSEDLWCWDEFDEEGNKDFAAKSVVCTQHTECNLTKDVMCERLHNSHSFVMVFLMVKSKMVLSVIFFNF